MNINMFLRAIMTPSSTKRFKEHPQLKDNSARVSTSTYIREKIDGAIDEVVEKKSSSEYTAVDIYANGVSKTAFIWSLGVLVTSLISFNAWLVSSLYGLDTRVSIMEKNLEIIKEIKLDLKDIKNEVQNIRVDMEKLKVLTVLGKPPLNQP
jgi:hypothetical protein